MRASSVLAILCSVLAQDDASHFPLVDGAVWTYSAREARWNTKVGEPGPLRVGQNRTVQCAQRKEGPTLTPLDGMAPTHYIVTQEGIYQTKVDPANRVLKFPLKKADDWGPGDKKNGLPRFLNHGQKEIEISGTKYLCWKISEIRGIPKGTRTWTRFYAPNVGLVCEESVEETDGAVTKRVYELESYRTPDGK
jgi:hypothetical protein